MTVCDAVSVLYDRKSMNELSLFTGAGGGVLGSKLLGHRIIGYVENNDYRQRVIAQRIKDGIFDEAPIFGDIAVFNREGYAESYSGLVDVVSGGFPCQDLSCAGKGAGLDGEKSGLWFEMAATVRIVRPRYVFIENVPMLLVRGFGRVLSSLYQMGYSAAWGIVSASDVGAPHLRKRLWIVAHRNTDNSKTRAEQQGRGDEQRETAFGNGGDDMADTQKQPIGAGLCKDEQAEVGRRRSCNGSSAVPDSCKQGLSKSEQKTIFREGRREEGRTAPECDWWSTERGLDRVAYGVANRVERLAAIGDGQVPTVAAFAFKYLRAVIERQ